MRYVLLFLFVLFLLSCKSEREKERVVASISGEDIYSQELDGLIKQELFDELNRIYKIKSEALRQLINNRLLTTEAKNKGMLKEVYVENYVSDKISQLGYDFLYRKFKIGSNIHNFHSKELYYIPDTTFEGKMLKQETLKSCLITELIDSLRGAYKIETYLYPPKSPQMKLDNILAYYRGDTLSKVSVLILSDFDCESCITAYGMYNSIYEEYKDRVKFGYANFSATPTLAQIACDAANEQDCFWSYHDALYSHAGIIDSAAVYRIAKELKMDLAMFKRDIESSERKDKIEKTINQLVLMGVYATPTVIVNGRLIVDSNAKNEITYLINEELNK